LGNVALLDIHGKEIWEKHVKSMLGQVCMFGALVRECSDTSEVARS
jgi:hypothetical protein